MSKMNFAALATKSRCGINCQPLVPCYTWVGEGEERKEGRNSLLARPPSSGFWKVRVSSRILRGAAITNIGYSTVRHSTTQYNIGKHSHAQS
jgi:hypothetical protein